DRVHLERRPRIDHGGAGREGDVRQRREHLGGTGAGHHFGRLDAEVGGDVVDERGRGRSGIVARNRRGGGGGLDDTRQRRQVVLVRGQFVRGQTRRADGRFSGHVGRELGQRVTKQETIRHVPIVA